MIQKNKKDCLPTCLSKLLKIDYDKIPKFYEYYNEPGRFIFEYDKWLKENGYIRISIEIKKANRNIIIPYISVNKFNCIGVLKKKGRKYSHAVLIHSVNGKIEIEDPKENSEYAIEDLIIVEILIKNNSLV